MASIVNHQRRNDEKESLQCRAYLRSLSSGGCDNCLRTNARSRPTPLTYSIYKTLRSLDESLQHTRRPRPTIANPPKSPWQLPQSDRWIELFPQQTEAWVPRLRTTVAIQEASIQWVRMFQRTYQLCLSPSRMTKRS